MSCVDHNAFLLESESRNLSLLYHFGGDSTLVPQILNVIGIDQAKILTKIAISLHEVKSERLSPIFMKSSFL